MKFCLILGSLTFLLGISFIFAPGLLSKANNCGNRILFTDERAFVYRRICGIMMLAAAIFLLCTGVRYDYF